MTRAIRKTAYSDGVDVRMRAAIDHAEAHEVIDRITGMRPALLNEVGFHDFMRRQNTSSFLSGYDFAMKRKYPELIAESTSLHNRLLDIELVADGCWLEAADFVDGGGI